MTDAVSTATLASSVYLTAYLAPLLPALDRDDVTDIFINRAEEIWVETIGGGIEQQTVTQLDATRLQRIVRQIASISHQGINRAHPLLSATLPGGARVQVVAPPATRGSIAIAIRKHVVATIELSEYRHGSSADNLARAFEASDGPSTVEFRTVMPDDVTHVLESAVRDRKTIVISGGTSSGKTTFLNALLAQVPRDERLILIEDTAELKLVHLNAVGLVAVRGQLGESGVTADELLQASLRMRPDRIILGELRGTEAFSFLRAINTGHPGSMTTVHANDPAGAIEQIVLMTLMAGTSLTRADITEYITRTVDVFVHLDRQNGTRSIRSVLARSDHPKGQDKI